MSHLEGRAPVAQPQTSTLAVISLVLGLMFCILGPLTAIPAIICGHIALSRVRRSGGAETGKGMAVAGLVLGYLGTVISILLLLHFPAFFEAREAAYRAACRNNLKQIGQCLRMYSQSYDGALPGTLSALYPEFATDPNVFVCPTSGKRLGDPAHIDEWCDYTLVPGLRMTGTPADADVLVCFDSEYRHMMRLRNELYLDGQVELRRLGQPLRSAPAKQP